MDSGPLPSQPSLSRLPGPYAPRLDQDQKQLPSKPERQQKFETLNKTAPTRFGRGPTVPFRASAAALARGRRNHPRLRQHRFIRLRSRGHLRRSRNHQPELTPRNLVNAHR